MSKLILKESEISEIRKMYLIENVSDKKDGTSMRASDPDFWNFIKYHEGDPKSPSGTIKKPMLKAYPDTNDNLTIGYGHTGSDVKEGLVITKEQAQSLLEADAAISANCVRRILQKWKDDGLQSYMVTQGEFDSLVSLVFNSGCKSVRMSRFIQYLKKGQNKKAGESILKYKSKGLTNRRTQESNMFLS
jgi:lysozyme|tara:strand:+ start:487 stop:1053 length:567 start_codon:yes stop_codon:yes gene_type:complete